jgi:oligo-1,6-glucosidase
MQWDDSANAGFSSGTPWIAVNPNYTEINAKIQVDDPDSVFSYYKKLIALRKNYEIIVYGTYQLLLAEDENLYVYTRTLGEKTLLVLCNFSEEEQKLAIPESLRDRKCEILIGNYERSDTNVKSLQPYEGLVLYYA